MNDASDPMQSLPFPGLDWRQTPQAILIRSATPLDILCSGMVGGGLLRGHYILNMHVDKDYAGRDPVQDLKTCAENLGVSGPFAGLMTAAWVHHARPFAAREEEVGVCVLATIGLGNATAAGYSRPARWHAGTINLMLVADACLTPAALVNLAITITEAKCNFLRRLGWQTSDGYLATGTSTDAIAIAATGRGAVLPYAGPATPIGYLAARLVTQALEAAAADHALSLSPPSVGGDDLEHSA